MPAVAISVTAIVLIAIVLWLLLRSRGPESAGAGAASSPRAAPPPPVADFHVEGDTATVSFHVPLPGEVDDVLRDLLVHEAVEVVREKRHRLPITGVTRVVARGRRDGGWETAGSVSLETPGELPPPQPPPRIPGIGRHDFDPFDQISDLPEHAPGLASGAGRDTLGPLAAELRLPAAVEAALRSQGVDPAETDAAGLILGIMRLGGATVTPRDDDTYEVHSGGRRTMVRVVPHRPGDHPELDDGAVRRFAADFATSGADRALLITEKYSPFEVYERERRDPRARYIARERVQPFIDALSLG